ncbi:FkbM family methyltransferase [Campylobacter coli]|nr:FkbM family methyltransferase [Campylobacter coli]EIT3367130.1 FkbM family methyltransferase [Campylobacter coli]EJK6697097.1 FkbM family methyltransferase [Campylobacter coli]
MFKIKKDIKDNYYEKKIIVAGISVFQKTKNVYNAGKYDVFLKKIKFLNFTIFKQIQLHSPINYFNHKRLQNKKINQYVLSSENTQLIFSNKLKQILTTDMLYNLSKNLDNESIKTINTILYRLKNINEECDFVFANDDEIDKLKDIEQNFLRQIITIDNETYFYNGFFLPINHFEASVFFYKHNIDCFQKNTLSKIHQKSIIDVGGYIGDSAIVFEKEFPYSNIYCFEASQNNYNLLLKTLKLNNSQKITAINKGLGSENKTTKLSFAGICSTLCSEISDQYENIEIITLDDYVKTNNIEVGLIKVDIEGFEQDFLKGALETIKKHKPALILSIYHNIDDFFNIKPFIEQLNLGYTFKIIKPVDGSISLETILLCEVN